MMPDLASARLNLCPQSLIKLPLMQLGLACPSANRKLAVLVSSTYKGSIDFDGDSSDLDGNRLLICSPNSKNASALRQAAPWLSPQPVGLHTSAGMGDRLGIATPGHVRAMRHFQGSIMPIFAQQSIREMQRTGRSPQQVLDDATWGMFEEGWHSGAGADADHLKSPEDIDICLAAGFSFYTFDPGNYVNNLPESISLAQAEEYLASLPRHLHPDATHLKGKKVDLEGNKVIIDELSLYKAVAKYGGAISHVVELYQHLVKEAGDLPFEVEVSMDETDQPTTPLEHIYIASELRRLGVHWVSFAPRFVGSFEKGVDYIGDVSAFEKSIALHAIIAREFGPYKLSLHSGSDKFTIYPIFMEKSKGCAHLKTAGTSYLEALRTIASLEPELFKDIYVFALQHFENDKQSYHISAQLSRAPKPHQIYDWPALLDQFDTREILHVTFGSVLTALNEFGERIFYDRLMATLETNRQAYFSNLEKHFIRHLQPFTSLSTSRRS